MADWELPHPLPHPAMLPDSQNSGQKAQKRPGKKVAGRIHGKMLAYFHQKWQERERNNVLVKKQFRDLATLPP
jgi:hypothetical protein